MRKKMAYGFKMHAGTNACQEVAPPSVNSGKVGVLRGLGGWGRGWGATARGERRRRRGRTTLGGGERLGKLTKLL